MACVTGCALCPVMSNGSSSTTPGTDLVILANTVKEDLVHDTRSQSARPSRPEDISCIGRTACIIFRRSSCRSSCSFVRRSKLSHLPVSIKTCIAYKLLSRFATDVVKCGTIPRRSIAASFRSMPQSKRPYDDCHKSPHFYSRNSTARCQRGVYTFRVVAQRSLIGLPPRATPETVGLFNRNESRVFCTGIPSTPDQPVNGRCSQQAPTPWPAGAPLSGLNLLQVGALIKLGPPIGAPRQPTGALFSCPKHSASLGTLTSIFPEGLKCFSHDQIPLHPLLQTCLRCRCAGCSAFAHNPSHTACLPLI